MFISFRFPRVIARLGLVGACALSAACMSDRIASVVPPDIDNFAWSLSNDVKATTIAIGGTQRIVATPYYVTGEPVSGLPTPTFTSSDPAKVTVDSTGLVTGVLETGAVKVASRLTVNGVTYTDTTLVVVTPTTAAPVSLHLTTSVGTILGITDQVNFSVEIDDANGDPIPGMAVDVSTPDPKRLQVVSAYSLVWGNQLGHAQLIARTTSYGVSLVDTLNLFVQYTTQGSVYVGSDWQTGKTNFQPSAVLIGVGGSVRWNNFNGVNANITFDDPSQVVGGNITDFSIPFQTRTFPAVGTYNYTDTNTGVKGSVIVREQPPM